MKFSGNVGNGMREKGLNLGGDWDSSLDRGIFKGFFRIAMVTMYMVTKAYK